MRDLIIITAIDDTKSSERNINLYKLFRIYAPYNAYLYYTGEDKNRIWKMGNIKTINTPLRLIKNSIIILCGYSDFFLDLNNSNIIIYMARNPFLSRNELLLLSKLDRIVAETAHQAYNIALQVKYHNPKIKITAILPWTDPKQYNINKYISPIVESPNPKWMSKAFYDLELTKTSFKKKTNAMFCSAPESLYEAIQYMLSGRAIMASSRFRDLIIPKFNGFIVDTIVEAVSAVQILRDLHKSQEIGHNARSHIEALLEPYSYINTFGQIIDGQIPDLLPYKFERDFRDRRWIIREQVMQSGDIKYLPEKFHPDFRIADLQDFNEIIEYFSTQLFGDIYIFGFEFPDYNNKELHQARTLVNRLGYRGKKLHFCLDHEIPRNWTGIFEKLSIISKSEAMKRIK